MSRSKSLLVALERAARAAARAERQRQIDENRRVREVIRQEREKLRLQSAMDRVGRQRYQQERAEECQRMTTDIQAYVAALRALLTDRQNPTKSSILSSLQYHEPLPSLTVPAELEKGMPQPVRNTYLRSVRPLPWWEKLTRYEADHRRRVAQAEDSFRRDFAN